MFARDVEMFIEHCENKGLATKTIGSYEQTLRLLMLWLDEQGITQTEKITHVVIQDYVKQIKERGKYTVTSNPNSGNYQERRIDFGKKVSDVTINNYLRNMSAFFNWCVEEGLILRSPVKRRDYIKVERRPLEFVSDEDFRKLLRNMNTASFSEYRDYIIIQLLLDTGMRINECLMIQVTDVNLPKRYIYLPAENTKGKKGRHVFFSDKMATQLQRWIKYKDRYRDSDFLFCTNKGKFLEVSNFEKNVRKYAQRIGLKDIHPHVFRNNFAKRFLMSGGDIYTLSRLLGHSSVTVTEQAYLDVNQEDLAEMYRKHSPLSKIKGKFLEVSNFEKNVRKYAQRIGLKDIHPHVFRNNFAKRFLMSGGDIYTLSRLLGHSSVTVTEQAYLDVNQEDLAEMYRKHSPLSKII